MSFKKWGIRRINVVMTAVTSVRTNVKWNGERSEYFSPQRGICQRDQISVSISICALC
jgi:hypothetical protein